jgi:hypothetical protein
MTCNNLKGSQKHCTWARHNGVCLYSQLLRRQRLGRGQPGQKISKTFHLKNKLSVVLHAYNPSSAKGIDRRIIIQGQPRAKP